MSNIKIPAEIYSRVTGFYRPVKQWNKAKQEEFRNRKFFAIPEDITNESIHTNNIDRNV